jgi:hypothetical protein
MGPVFYINAGPGPALPDNFTFSYTSRTGSSNNVGYMLRLGFPILDSWILLTYVSAVYALASAGSPWESDALLNRTDADVILMMLNQNAVAYENPSDDPWMPAHTQANSVWRRDYPLTLMACAEQHQICNPSKGKSPSACTKLMGQDQVLPALGNGAADVNDYQAWTAIRILMNAITMSIYYVVQGRGGSALNGQSFRRSPLSSPKQLKPY